MVDLSEEVMRTGTAAGVRARGFGVPAAGKTGTNPNDGWFAGFTSELLCVVWVGFDDNRELDLEGAKSALPIWTEFMKRALEYKEYKNARPFDSPDGVVAEEIDPLSGQAATPACPTRRMEVFIAGTQPLGTCPLHGGGQPAITRVTGWDTTASAPQPMSSPTPSNFPQPPLSIRPKIVTGDTPAPAVANAQQADKAQEKKKGFFGRIFGVFK